MIYKKSYINEQLSKIGNNFKCELEKAKEISGFTKIAGPRVLDNFNTVNIYWKYFNIKGFVIPENSLLAYYKKYPWVPHYSKSGMYKYVFMMNISNIKMVDLSNLIKDIREEYLSISFELDILELIVKEYTDLILFIKISRLLWKII